MRHRRTFAIAEPRQPTRPVRRIACSACKGTGWRHENGRPVVPWRHCRVCLGLGWLRDEAEQ